MNKTEILKTFNKFPMFSQIVADIESDKDWGEVYLKNLESMNFRGEMDLILYVRNHQIMGKFANAFDTKLADLTADVETKIGVFFIKNPQLEKVTFKKSTSGKLDFTAKICNSNNRNYIEVHDIARGTKEDMRNAFTIKQMIMFLEEIEDFLEQDTQFGTSFVLIVNV